MIQRYNKREWETNVDFFLMRAFWDPQVR